LTACDDDYSWKHTAALLEANRGYMEQWLKAHQGGDLQKVTLNLYRADVAELEALFGYGWSAELRELVHRYLERRRKDNA